MIPLRPLGLGDVLGGAFTVFARNARVLVLWGLLLSGVVGAGVQVLQALLQTGFQERMIRATAGGSDAEAVMAGSFAGFAVLFGLLALVVAIGKGFLQAPVAVDTAQRVLGRRASFSGLWKLLAGRRLAVLWWVLLEIGGGAVLLGAVAAIAVTVFAAGSIGGGVAVTLLLVLGFYVVVLWLGVRFVLTIPTIALEGLGPIAAAAQSWRLTRGVWWRTFGILLLVQVMFGFAVGIAGTPLTIAISLGSGVFDPLNGSGSPPATPTLSPGAVAGVVVGGVLIAAVTTVTDVLTASVLTLLTVDRRIRTEGLDQRIASHLDTGQPGDPFATAPAGAGPTRWGAPWQQVPGGAPQAGQPQGWPQQPGPWPPQGGPGQGGQQQGWPQQPGPWPPQGGPGQGGQFHGGHSQGRPDQPGPWPPSDGQR